VAAPAPTAEDGNQLDKTDTWTMVEVRHDVIPSS